MIIQLDFSFLFWEGSGFVTFSCAIQVGFGPADDARVWTVEGRGRRMPRRCFQKPQPHSHWLIDHVELRRPLCDPSHLLLLVPVFITRQSLRNRASRSGVSCTHTSFIYIYCFAIVHLGAFCIENALTLVATRSCPVSTGAHSGCNLFTSGCN
jgi:hypothetical protein